MRDIKAVYLEKDKQGRINKNNNPDESFETIDKSTEDFGCQYNYNKDNVICTCRRIKRRETGYFTTRQVYRSQRYYTNRDFTDVGVGSVKKLCKKKVRRIYLPQTEDRGVGSSNLSVLQRKARKNWFGSYYDQKKTSSKCVGGMEQTNFSLISEKLSPIIQTKSGSTSPTVTDIKNIDNESSFNNTQSNRRHQDSKKYVIPEVTTRIIEKDKMRQTIIPISNKTKSTVMSTNDDGKNCSSDSFVQHVYNLENPSYEKSKTSIDLIENQLEREYRKIFSMNSNERAHEKPIADLKSSMLRRRFAALRKLGKKEEKTDKVPVKVPSKNSVPNRKDVSIASDPPSLEARSYSSTKLYSPIQSIPNVAKREKGKKELAPNWLANDVDSDYQDVKSMFKLWGKKFDLEESKYKKTSRKDSVVSKKQKKKVEIIVPKTDALEKGKKEGKKFSFFRKKSKDKSKIFKSKKGVTAGRCEVGDGLMIKVGAANDYKSEKLENKFQNIHEYDILRKAWFRRFMYNEIDSQNSVKIRWNNNMYTTSSSTVFELMDCLYKNTGIVYRSRSQVTTGDSSYYSPTVNFMHQSIEAWMIPTITDGIRPKNKNKIEVSYSNQKWLIDKSKAFSQKIELVLHSNIQNKLQSSEYIIIDIPKGYFTDTSSEEKIDPLSDELIYNIVEYDIPNSKSHFQNIDKKNKMETGDTKNVHLTISVKDYKQNSKIFEKVIKNPPLHRDVVIQGSDVYFPRRCDVIEVGIITQRDVRDRQKPILKIHDDPTDDESKILLPPTKTCELAESFLQDYYRNCSPLGFDVFNWCISESKLRGSSENNSLKSQGDGSKSCPNMVEEYQTSAIVSPCETSSCSQCNAKEKKEDSKGKGFFKNFVKKPLHNPAPTPDGKRVLPKDSLEVFKKRKIYATSNKSKWVDNYEKCEPYSIPSIEEKGAQNSLIQCPKPDDPCINSSKKKYKKHVSLQDCDVMDEILKEQLSDKVINGILSFKGASSCDSCKSKNSPSSRRTRVISDPICEIPQSPCKEDCLKEKIPVRSKKKSPTCNSTTPPLCPVGPPTPCQKPCPPSTPPCRLEPPSLKTSSSRLLPQSPRKIPSTACSKNCSQSSLIRLNTQSSRTNKPVPPRIHSPPFPSKSCQSCMPPKTPPPANLHNCLSPSQSKCSLNSNCTPKKIEKTSCHDFPWPTKNQISNTPSKESDVNLKMSPPPKMIEKISSKGIDGIKRLIQKLSGSIAKDQKCKPDCTNIRKEHKLCSPGTPNRPKMTGLQLKKAPMPKSTKNCSGDEGIIRLSSKEKITIKLRQSSPSTDEIREGCNIKVQDEDGQTIYERKEYRKIDNTRTQFVKDTYRESHIQRITTTNSDMDSQDTNLKGKDSKSSTTLSNIIEINFSIKFKQGDRTTEVCIKNCGDTAKDDKEQKVNSRCGLSKDIYILNDQTKNSEEVKDIGTKDVNIKIMIKNDQLPNVKFQKTNKPSANSITDKFSKNISEKFNTVCTGCSDVIDQPTYSIHQATFNLTNSETNKALSKSSIELLAEELKDPESVKLTDTDESENEVCSKEAILDVDNINQEDTDQIVLITESESQIISNKCNIQTSNDEKSATTISATDNEIHSEINNIDTNEVIPKVRNKEEKKKMLKEIFETSSKDRNKGKIRQMLRAVLTSDSSGYDVEVQNELADHESLKSNFFKNSDNITKYLNSALSVQSMRNEFEQLIYPTEENNSECTESDENENLGCLCSQLGNKLKLNENNARSCCCGRVDRRDEEVNCDLRNLHKCCDKKHIDVEIKNSINSKHGSVTVKDENGEKSAKAKDSYKLSSNFKIKACHIKQFNRRTVLGISDDDEIVLLSSEECSRSKRAEPINILQLYETKKAVLEIYAEKAISENRKRIVAKLPKFVYERESEIRHYQEIVAGYKRKFMF